MLLVLLLMQPSMQHMTQGTRCSTQLRMRHTVCSMPLMQQQVLCSMEHIQLLVVPSMLPLQAWTLLLTPCRLAQMRHMALQISLSQKQPATTATVTMSLTTQLLPAHVC
jgi:hypothetical protein